MLRARWLGTVPYGEALELQRALFDRSPDDHLLLLEHPHVYTLGVRATTDHVLVDPASVGAELVPTDRGGDVTYHGPGQLVGYPILTLPPKPGRGAATGLSDTVAYVRTIEQVLIDALADLGRPGAGRLRAYPGVWIDPEGERPRKIAAIGVRVTRGRTMHGFALNVSSDLTMFDHIVPCGITGLGVTSLRAEGVDATMAQVVDAVVARAAVAWGAGSVERQDVDWFTRPGDLSAFSRGEGPGRPARAEARLQRAGVTGGLQITSRKPEWLRAPVRMGPEYASLKRTMRDLSLVTVCEEAGCPNIFECWADGTATFMINGERCTRACGFCLVDTRHPLALDPGEPARVAEAVTRLGLAHAVVTAVARDDLPDGGAAQFAATVEAIRGRCPSTAVEVLVPDCKGDPAALATLFAARPDVLNHNLETVARLQRTVRPQASYARSLGVLGAAKSAGLTTKSGLIVGMGETFDEVLAAMVDLRNVGVDILTVGQYLRPTSGHLPVDRWWKPEEFERLAAAGRAMGFAHVEASPLTRSSYHAQESAAAAR